MSLQRSSIEDHAMMRFCGQGQLTCSRLTRVGNFVKPLNALMPPILMPEVLESRTRGQAMIETEFGIWRL
jgi:hypothetical protein